MAPLRRTVFTPKPVPIFETGVEKVRPEDFSTFVKFVEQQFRELAKAISVFELLQMFVTHVEPQKPREGMIAYADGTNWNPGSGEGLYVYDGAQWIKASDWNQIFKGADESTASDTTFSDDASLKFAVAASAKYAFEFEIWYDTPAVADFKWQITGPATPTLILVDGFALAPGATSLTITRDAAFSQSHALTETSGTAGYVKAGGILHNGLNAGTVALQWAQNTSDAGNTTVRAGSRVQFRRVV